MPQRRSSPAEATGRSAPAASVRPSWPVPARRAHHGQQWRSNGEVRGWNEEGAAGAGEAARGGASESTRSAKP